MVASSPALPRQARASAAAAIVAFIAIGLVRSNSWPALAAGAVAIVAGIALVAVPRRLALPVAAVLVAAVAVIGNGTSSNVGWFAACIPVAWLTVATSRRDGLIAWAATAAVFGGEQLWTNSDPGWGAWAAGLTVFLLSAYVVRHSLDLVTRLRAAQAELAERARAEERNRIARELHDVIAHSLTVSLLHISSARLALQYDPDDAGRALAEAERLSRETLAEVRGTVGLLRPTDGESTTAPLPTAGRIPYLVEEFRAAGTEVSLHVTGELARVPATTGLAAYRILQQALANAARHAPGAEVRIAVDVRGNSMALSVDSAGEPGAGSGLGRASMRERAESVGGDCTSGPGGRGWLVTARLPLGEREHAT